MKYNSHFTIYNLLLKLRMGGYAGAEIYCEERQPHLNFYKLSLISTRE